MLRYANNPNRIVITNDCKRDLACFKKFLEQYNSVSIYDYKNADFVVQLDTCLIGMGGCWKNLSYNLPIPLGYKAMGKVHLEMINILVATKLFKNVWSGYKIANLISKLNFYKLIPYPMDNC